MIYHAQEVPMCLIAPVAAWFVRLTDHLGSHTFTSAKDPGHAFRVLAPLILIYLSIWGYTCYVMCRSCDSHD